MTVGATLAEIRDRIETLADVGGAYYVVCGRTGHRPVPVADKWFADRAAARRAASAATEYRAALRRYDPTVAHYDLVVCQAHGRSTTEPGHACHGSGAARRTLSSPVVTEATGTEAGRGRLVEWCHRLAAATFESLSDRGHRAIERTTMEQYTELAEAVPTPDGLCVCLLERMAVTLSQRLDRVEQTAVLARTADRLGPPEDTGNPVAAAFTELHDHGVVGDFSPPDPSDGPEAPGTRPSVSGVRFSEYALSPREGRLPVLPIVVGLFRRSPDRPPRSLRVEAAGAAWRVEVGFGTHGDPTDLLHAPIHSHA